MVGFAVGFVVGLAVEEVRAVGIEEVHSVEEAVGQVVGLVVGLVAVELDFGACGPTQSARRCLYTKLRR